MNDRILLVEDEPILADLLADYLRKDGHLVHIIGDGSEVVDWVKTNSPKLIILDLMLPGKDGLTICKEIRQFSNVLILMATAKVDEIDRLLGLEFGADDYICKPYSPREVVARVKANLRRMSLNTELGSEPLDSRISLDDKRYRVSYAEKWVELTAVEYQLFSILCSEPGRIFSRDQIMNNMYKDHRIVSDRTIDSHVRKIRKKLSEINTEYDFIQSVYGAGYRFEVN